MAESTRSGVGGMGGGAGSRRRRQSGSGHRVGIGTGNGRPQYREVASATVGATGAASCDTHPAPQAGDQRPWALVTAACTMPAMTHGAESAHNPSRRHAVVAVTVAAMAYVLALAALQGRPGASLIEPLFLLAVLGVVFPLLAWVLTRSPRSPPSPAPGEPARLPAMLLYLLAFSVLVLGWGFSALQQAYPDEPAQSVVQLLVKLVTMVALPVWLFARWRQRRPGPLGGKRLLWVFAWTSLAYLALQAVFGRGLTTLADLSPAASTLAWAIPACWLWQTLEAGLAEEVLFRRVLQEKLAIATDSPVAAIAWASLLFGLAHAPGLWLRGASLMEGVAEPTPGWAVAYSIVMIAPAGIAFGVLWARTRSLWLIVPLHGTVDLIPQLAPFIRAWGGG